VVVAVPEPSLLLRSLGQCSDHRDLLLLDARGVVGDGRCDGREALVREGDWQLVHALVGVGDDELARDVEKADHLEPPVVGDGLEERRAHRDLEAGLAEEAGQLVGRLVRVKRAGDGHVVGAGGDPVDDLEGRQGDRRGLGNGDVPRSPVALAVIAKVIAPLLRAPDDVPFLFIVAVAVAYVVCGKPFISPEAAFIPAVWQKVDVEILGP